MPIAQNPSGPGRVAASGWKSESNAESMRCCCTMPAKALEQRQPNKTAKLNVVVEGRMESGLCELCR